MNFSFILALIVFSVLVISHEFGHFLLAKRNGIGVTEFSVGMGPRIISKEFGGTRYSWKLIPFGGSCMMVGEDQDNESEDAFNSKSPLARFSVIAAGPIFNFILALLLSVFVLTFGGVNEARVQFINKGYGAEKCGIEVGDVIRKINGHKIVIGRDIDLYFLNHPMDGTPIEVELEHDGEIKTVSLDTKYEVYLTGFSYYATEEDPVIGDITPGYAMEKAGAQVGDRILSINGEAIATGAELQEHFAEHPLDENEVTFVVEREGEEITLTVTPSFVESNTLGMEASFYRNTEAGALKIIRYCFSEVRYWMSYTLTSLKMLVSGHVGVNDLSGPVGIVSMVGEVVEESKSDGILYVFLNLANFAILLSVNLGVINLLPLPALDGGRLVFIVIEMIRRKPVPREKEGMVHTIGILLLFALMIFIMFNDIMKIFR